MAARASGLRKDAPALARCFQRSMSGWKLAALSANVMSPARPSTAPASAPFRSSACSSAALDPENVSGANGGPGVTASMRGAAFTAPRL
jgi:hypothetical protein